MAEESESAEIRTRLQSDVHWLRGALAGFVAAVAMALVVGVLGIGLFDTIAAMYGQAGTPVYGVLAHLVHGTLFGLLFAAVLSDPGLYAIEAQPVRSVLAGLVFGLALAVAGTGLILPIWVNALAGDLTLSIPYITGPLLVYHLVYGSVLGLVYGLTDV